MVKYKLIDVFSGTITGQRIDISLINKEAKNGWRVVFIEDPNKAMTNKQISCLLETDV